MRISDWSSDVCSFDLSCGAVCCPILRASPAGPPFSPLHARSSKLLPTNILFLAETNLSPSLAEQRAQCEASGDVIVEAGQVSFLDLPRKLAQQGFELGSGDRIKIYDFTCLPVNTMTLVRLMVKLLGKGVRSEEHTSEECVSTCSFRWSPDH